MARKIDPINPDRRKVSAGKEAIQLARECISHERDFSVETTLAGGNVIRLMRAAKENGFEVTLFYVGLNDVCLNIERVASRVRNGGHHIPTEDILRRQTTSMQNLLKNLLLIDYLIVVDNSEASGKIILQADKQRLAYQADPIPDRALSIQNELDRLRGSR